MLLLRYDFSLRCNEPCEWICPICKEATEPPVRNEARCRTCGVVTPKAKCKRCGHDVAEPAGERQCHSEVTPATRRRALYNPRSPREEEGLWSFKTDHDDMLQVKAQLDRCKKFISYELLDHEGPPQPEQVEEKPNSAHIAWALVVLLVIGGGIFGYYFWDYQKDSLASLWKANGEVKKLSALNGTLIASNANLRATVVTQSSQLVHLSNDVNTTKLVLKSRESSLAQLRAELELTKELASQNQLTSEDCAERVKKLTAQIAALENVEKPAAPSPAIPLSPATGDTFESSEFFARQAIVGIQGKQLGRVVFLFDTSSSMRASQRWNQATNILATWAKYLSIHECSVVSFSDTVGVFPAQGMLTLRDPATKATHNENQKILLDHVSHLPTGTYTDTLSGLLRAYQYTNAEAIILFTDGRPKTMGDTSRRMRDAILTLVRAHPHPPINVIALGDYEILESEDKSAGKNLEIAFLRELASLSAGTFMAR